MFIITKITQLFGLLDYCYKYVTSPLWVVLRVFLFSTSKTNGIFNYI